MLNNYLKLGKSNIFGKWGFHVSSKLLIVANWGNAQLNQFVDSRVFSADPTFLQPCNQSFPFPIYQRAPSFKMLGSTRLISCQGNISFTSSL